ncbi:hypothetical protein EYF80_043703 [Liparis tanakae]|uniref:Uncharacterized protein n=1 Tax=Liparis tanakae TaxID=230148 RepID=A0A4Z2FZ05_9TELE|nr:hypothetical protein EYF80_043703 [Liparis tanakae]
MVLCEHVIAPFIWEEGGKMKGERRKRGKKEEVEEECISFFAAAAVLCLVRVPVGVLELTAVYGCDIDDLGVVLLFRSSRLLDLLHRAARRVLLLLLPPFSPLVTGVSTGVFSTSFAASSPFTTTAGVFFSSSSAFSSFFSSFFSSASTLSLVSLAAASTSPSAAASSAASSPPAPSAAAASSSSSSLAPSPMSTLADFPFRRMKFFRETARPKSDGGPTGCRVLPLSPAAAAAVASSSPLGAHSVLARFDLGMTRFLKEVQISLACCVTVTPPAVAAFSSSPPSAFSSPPSVFTSSAPPSAFSSSAPSSPPVAAASSGLASSAESLSDPLAFPLMPTMDVSLFRPWKVQERFSFHLFCPDSLESSVEESPPPSPPSAPSSLTSSPPPPPPPPLFL